MVTFGIVDTMQRGPCNLFPAVSWNALMRSIYSIFACHVLHGTTYIWNGHTKGLEPHKSSHATFFFFFAVDDMLLSFFFFLTCYLRGGEFRMR